jgi:hypothetical protein
MVFGDSKSVAKNSKSQLSGTFCCRGGAAPGEETRMAHADTETETVVNPRSAISSWVAGYDNYSHQ